MVIGRSHVSTQALTSITSRRIISFTHFPPAPQRSIFTWFGNDKTASHTQEAFTEEQGTWSEDFLSKIQGDDPHGRIRPLRPYFDRAELDRLDGLFRRSEEEKGRQELHCLPFWTMLHLTVIRPYLCHTEPGAEVERKIGQNAIRLCFGYSIAAVGPDHWARDLVLFDDAWDMRAELERTLRQMTPEDTEPDRWLRGLHFPASRAPVFERGYPVLRDDKVMAAFAAAYKDALPQYRWEVRLEDRVHTLAIPTKRIVCKTSYPHGEAYWDGFFPPQSASPSHRFLLPKQGPLVWPESTSEPRTVAFARGDDLADKVGFRYRFMSEIATEDSGRYTTATSGSLAGGPTDHVALAQTIIAAANRATLDWNDPNILPAYGGPDVRKNNLHAAVEYSIEYLKGQEYVREPLPRGLDHGPTSGAQSTPWASSNPGQATPTGSIKAQRAVFRPARKIKPVGRRRSDGASKT